MNDEKKIGITKIENEVKVVDPEAPVEATKPEWVQTHKWKLERVMTEEEREQWNEELKEHSTFLCDNQEDKPALEKELERLRKLEDESTGNRKVQYQILIDLLKDFIKDMFSEKI